jgi:hypothetical protein
MFFSFFIFLFALAFSFLMQLLLMLLLLLCFYHLFSFMQLSISAFNAKHEGLGKVAQPKGAPLFPVPLNAFVGHFPYSVCQ